MENVFLTHGWEYGFECVRSFRSRDVSEFSCFCCHPPLPDQPRPPTARSAWHGSQLCVRKGFEGGRNFLANDNLDV